mmetsp:Transcript_10530/g.29615  ORF Transcript_10530/g.29615 Transcript_10530/m.29615 type:complete len:99 (-) Transcript_10530:899-1195(-)
MLKSGRKQIITYEKNQRCSPTLLFLPLDETAQHEKRGGIEFVFLLPVHILLASLQTNKANEEEEHLKICRQGGDSPFWVGLPKFLSVETHNLFMNACF